MTDTNAKTTINLFEFANRNEYSGDVEELESFLDHIWNDYKKTKSNQAPQ